MNFRGRLASDFFSVAVFQIIGVIGQLVGVRILTETLSPAVFGEVILWVGAAALATTTLFSPTMQALLRYYPKYAPMGGGWLIERAAFLNIKRTFFLSLPLSLPLIVLGVMESWIDIIGVILLLMLLTVDGMRTLRTTIMNANRQHHRYGMWKAGEAWGRPLLAYVAITWWGIHTEVVIMAFITTSIALYGLNSFISDRPSGVAPIITINETDLLRIFKTYSRPLLPLGLLGWISSMADRYMIGGLLSPHDVGMYAAAYGLASRPMLMLSTIAETSIRPIYCIALGHNDSAASQKYLITWFVVVFLGGMAACGLFVFFHHYIAQFLLGSEFRKASYLMPWIVLGYGILAVHHILVRIFLAHDAPHLVTYTEALGAVLAVVIGFISIKTYGVVGAAVAVPIYFGIQLVGSVSLGFRSIRPRTQ
jgi:O-antigen/teichoic acid export membrane protein